MAAENSHSNDTSKHSFQEIAAVYALGGLPQDQKDAVDKERVHNAVLDAAIKQAESVVESLAYDVSSQPSPQLRYSILQRIVGGIPSVQRIATLTRSLSIAYRYAAVVSVIGISGIVFGLVSYTNKRNAEEQLITVRNELRIAEQSKGILASNMEQLRNRSLILTDAVTKQIQLVSAKPNDTSLASAKTIVYWNPQTKSVYVDVLSLPSNTDTTDYQLWALKDNKPIDVGVFNTRDVSIFRKMKNVDSADAFAITLEPKGGSASPSLAYLTVVGTVQ